MDAKKVAERQLRLLERGCDEIVPREALLEKLERSVETGRPLRVKLGIDPTGNAVHIGHMVPMGKLRQFQDLGHMAVLIIGDYTASIGDPTGRNAERPPLSLERVRLNAERYAEQIFRVVDGRKAELRWQSEWYGSLSLAELLGLAGSFSLAQLLAHETFRKRYDDGARVGLHELLYPVLQAYDSVMVGADVELGGTDQKFNVLAGRELQRDRGLDAQCAMLMPLLPGIDGRKMSKSLGNDIGVDAGPDEQFARVMAIRDEAMDAYRELVLLGTPEDSAEAASRLAAGENPMRLKLELASGIVERFNGQGSGRAARAAWERRFSRREAPDDVPLYACDRATDLRSLMRDAGLASSSSEAARLVAEGAVYSGDTRLSDPGFRIDPDELPEEGLTIRVGRRRYLRVVRG
ncbi:MAG TPA: tyrosine--tRNA ligase [Spirochaetales bacterium]|nr:tyrosine--tRNA ligase [Spirochaetales bacterium]HPM72637.1 tyrosine--tRNA ligase [Spirochaetales bacterium]